MAAATKSKPAPTEITLPALDIRQLTVTLVGDSSLVTHAWSEKAKQMMRDTQQKKAKTAREAKDPFAEFAGSLYWMSERPEVPTAKDVAKGRFGVPTIAIKSAAVDACSHVQGITKVEARGAFHLNGNLSEIIAAPPVMREDMVRVGMGSADIRYRGEFWPWKIPVNVRYNASVLSAEQIVQLFNVAGFAIGIGENRPQKDGSWGMFHVGGADE